MFRRRFFAILKQIVWHDPVLQDGDLYIKSANTVTQDGTELWIDPWFAYEPPVQVGNVLHLGEVVGVRVNNNVAEVI